MPERVRPAPHDPERAEPALVPAFQVPEPRLDRLGALEVQDRERVPVEPQLVGTAHERQLPLGDRDEFLGDPRRSLERERLFHRHLVAVVGRDDGRARIGGLVVARRDEDGEEAGGDSAFAHSR